MATPTSPSARLAVLKRQVSEERTKPTDGMPSPEERARIAAARMRALTASPKAGSPIALSSRSTTPTPSPTGGVVSG